MPRTIVMGQMWWKNTTGEKYLVTKTYSEVFSTYAVLRKVGDETGSPVRVKVENTPEGVTLPGFSFARES